MSWALQAVPERIRAAGRPLVRQADDHRAMTHVAPGLPPAQALLCRASRSGTTGSVPSTFRSLIT
jgi:hypothetical protein